MNDRQRLNATAPRDASPVWWLWGPLALGVALAALAQIAPGVYAAYFEPELGVLELVHVLEGVAIAVLAGGLLALPAVHQRAWLAAWAGLALAGGVYVGGEEASWGQHLFAWSTPDTWRQLNDQNETNLHNVSSWFDQKPRLILELAIYAGALALPLWPAARARLGTGRLAYLVPTVHCVPAAAMVAVTRAADLAGEATGAGAILFYRGSEVQELFLYLTVIVYLAVLHRRVRTATPPG